jgi:hypothetical protein
MRLSEVLSRSPSLTFTTVDGFLDDRPLGWGKHRKIAVGTVVHNFYCRQCGDLRTFASGASAKTAEPLYALGLGENSVSIDVALRCMICEGAIEAWFLVGSKGDISGRLPEVRVEKYMENLRDRADRIDGPTGPFSDVLKRSQVAYEAGLGAGAMIYLRKIFESVTHEVAEIAEIPLTTPKGWRRPFKEILREVNDKRSIIPLAYSGSGYTLFSELSDVIHGDADEALALAKYEPCRDLVLGVVDQVNRDNQYARAIEELGWAAENINEIAAAVATS